MSAVATKKSSRRRTSLETKDAGHYRNFLKRAGEMVHLRPTGNGSPMKNFAKRAFGTPQKAQDARVHSVAEYGGILDGIAGAVAFRAGADSPEAVRALEWAEKQRELVQDNKKIKARRELIQAASLDRDSEASRLLNRSIYFTQDCMINANGAFSKFFETRQIAHNEKPFLRCTFDQEINVRCLGNEGKPGMVQPICQGEEKPVPLCYLVSDMYEYPIWDICNGFDVANWSLEMIDIAEDLRMAEECLLAQYILVGSPHSSILQGGFITDGNKANRSYNAHSKADVDNFPLSNYIELANNTANTLPRRDMFLQIARYMKSWGPGAFSDGDLGMPCIVIPSAHCHGFLQDMQLNAGNDNEKYSCQILDSGGFAFIEYGGIRFEVIASNFLSPKQGMAYVGFNKCVGTKFEKPELEHTEEEMDKSCNKASIYTGKVIGFGQMDCQKMNVLGVRYKTPDAP